MNAPETDYLFRIIFDDIDRANHESDHFSIHDDTDKFEDIEVIVDDYVNCHINFDAFSERIDDLDVLPFEYWNETEEDFLFRIIGESLLVANASSDHYPLEEDPDKHFFVNNIVRRYVQKHIDFKAFKAEITNYDVVPCEYWTT